MNRIAKSIVLGGILAVSALAFATSIHKPFVAGTSVSDLPVPLCPPTDPTCQPGGNGN